jgi:hypothetical protein
MSFTMDSFEVGAVDARLKQFEQETLHPFQRPPPVTTRQSHASPRGRTKNFGRFNATSAVVARETVELDKSPAICGPVERDVITTSMHFALEDTGGGSEGSEILADDASIREPKSSALDGSLSDGGEAGVKTSPLARADETGGDSYIRPSTTSAARCNSSNSLSAASTSTAEPEAVVTGRTAEHESTATVLRGPQYLRSRLPNSSSPATSERAPSCTATGPQEVASGVGTLRSGPASTSSFGTAVCTGAPSTPTSKAALPPPPAGRYAPCYGHMGSHLFVPSGNEVRVVDLQGKDVKTIAASDVGLSTIVQASCEGGDVNNC